MSQPNSNDPNSAVTMTKRDFDELQKMLDDALSKEDYERAAKIRDEMGRRN